MAERQIPHEVSELIQNGGGAWRKISHEIAERITRRAESPNGKGIIRLCDVLKEASKDPLIAASQPARETVELLLVYVEDALSASSVDDVLNPLLRLLENENQRRRAKRPRTRKPDPAAGPAFVVAVKTESGKRQPHTAWSSLNADDRFAEFEIIAIDSAEVKYRHQGGKTNEITFNTFKRYWNEGVSNPKK